jgi:large subunit ribosomal protein L13Ae
MPFKKVVIVDCKGHLLGRLASIVAKELLSGQKIILVRTEEINVSGELFRNKLKWEAFRRKRTNTNPRRGGPFHYRSPADMVRRVIRGMLPRKTKRGDKALLRLTCFVGIPPPHDSQKRLVIPGALRITHLRPGRKFTRLGDLCKEIGWKYHDIVQRLEAKRTIRASAYYHKKQQRSRLRAKAVKGALAKPRLANAIKTLEQFGYPTA